MRSSTGGSTGGDVLTPEVWGAQEPVAVLGRDERADRTRLLLAEARAAADPVRRAELEQAVVVLNCRIADAVAMRFRNRGVPIEDLRQAAYEGLVKAVRRYQPDAAENLLTYAVPTIRGGVQRHLRDQRWMVRPPRLIHESYAELQAAIAHLEEHQGREPNDEEIRGYLGWDQAKHDEVCETMAHVRHTSLDQPVSDTSDGSGGDGRTLSEVPNINRGTDTEQDISRVETRLLLAPALQRLTERERRIVQLRFVEQQTLIEIADLVGLSTKRVSVILADSIAKLRRDLHDTSTHP